MKVAVEITDFRRGYVLMRELRERKIPFTIYRDGERYDYVLTTSRPKGSNWIPVEDPVKAVRTLMLRMNGRERLKELWIGIDPGFTPAVAVVGDRVLLERKVVSDIRNVKRVVEEIVEGYPADRVLVKVGSGDKLRRDALINMLVSHFDVVMVSEKNTSEGARRYIRDLNAAERIAFSHGRPVFRGVEPEIKDGDIREIQRLSRIMSGGQLTISRVLAMRVARGEITLEEALSLHRGGEGV